MTNNIATLDLSTLQLVTGGQSRDRGSQLPNVPTENNGSVAPTRMPAGGGGGIGQLPHQVMR